MTNLNPIALKLGVEYAERNGINNLGLCELQAADNIIAEWAFCTIYGDCLFIVSIDRDNPGDEVSIQLPVDPDEREWQVVESHALVVS